MTDPEVPAETEQEIERIGKGVAGQLQADEVVGFWQTLLEGGIPKRTAEKLIVVWMTPAPGGSECGCCLNEVEDP